MSHVFFNKDAYNKLTWGAYIHTAPHLRHKSIRNIYANMVQAAFDKTARNNRVLPTVLDLGAGEGSVTRTFLELGATVLAVDISEKQLDQLKVNCAGLPGKLELRCADLYSVLNEGGHYDIVVANSLLHHIPDYIDLVRRASTLVSESGVFFCFQDPMWKPMITRRDAILSWIAYTAWRLGQGDLVGGIWRRARRTMGFYLADSLHDNTEFHAVREGVNQQKICECLRDTGFKCEIVEYCSFHSDTWQPLGEKLNVKNTFGLLATRVPSTEYLS
jgi:SAM-dependent methyltransferase